MTERLFDKDSYIKEFDGKCIDCFEKDGLYYVELDKTCFFYEGGGQKGDKGTLNNINVVDTKIDNGIIYHLCESNINAGENVHGKICWEERFCKMQNHTAEHIISGLVKKHFGFDNVGFRLADDFVTMDYNGVLSKNDIDFLEKEANNISNANVNIKAYYPENADNLEYRSKIDIKENLRIVEIPNVDICACCAPHVKQTSETGLIKIINSEKNKGGTRLTMKSGGFALKEMAVMQENLDAISKMLSLPKSETAKGVSALLEKINGLEVELKSISLKEIIKIANESPVPYVFIDEPMFLKDAVNILKSRFSGAVGAFAISENGFRFMILSENSEAILSKMKANLSINGGGRNDMVQGSIHGNKTQLENVLKNVIFV